MLYYVLQLDGVIFFFFFKQKTAYEMRISDWSSDVCSSDLFRGGNRATHVVHRDGMLTRICQTSSSANQCFLCAHHAPGREAFRTASVAAQCKHGFMMAHGGQGDRTSTRLNSSHYCAPRIASSA